MEDKLWKIQKLRESRKKDRYDRRRRWDKLSKDPLEVNMADQRLLENWIRKTEEKRDEFAREAERLKGILKKAVEAQNYMESMTKEERIERYSKPQSWQNSPELNYIYEMEAYSTDTDRTHNHKDIYHFHRYKPEQSVRQL